MEFTAMEDIEAPIDAVFKAVSDFDGFEKAALRRGAKVERVECKGKSAALMAWNIEAKIRGKIRLIKADLVQLNSPNRLVFMSSAGGMKGDSVIELIALSRNHTRLNICTKLESDSLKTRLILQSMRLTKAKLVKKYRDQIAKFATDIEMGHEP